jgi:hypothetical protein
MVESKEQEYRFALSIKKESSIPGYSGPGRTPSFRCKGKYLKSLDDLKASEKARIIVGRRKIALAAAAPIAHDVGKNHAISAEMNVRRYTKFRYFDRQSNGFLFDGRHLRAHSHRFDSRKAELRSLRHCPFDVAWICRSFLSLPVTSRVNLASFQPAFLRYISRISGDRFLW